ncbi:LexA family transcriptional regulator [Pseudomonas abietaniphila]|uniref:Phage repressor protein C, contains Cro/C1-type HTH and peptisase s24 domains n=1 Tax=Pseudomonas abietaniphila TaxID=89065 RepID=A0A1G8LL79_9PSED|nr:LexA family transcriptional regulator [Pseudomonas abietaniphila]SDI56469.1 Phage repressor protein C, contains Cro/C1-type HTH and peptisase s24 domains [Pseudomonas abietaniphila]
MTKKKELSPELKAECDAAKALFVSKKNALGLTQASLAEEADISAAAVAMYLNGTNPLNAKFAAVFSRMIGEPIDKFSPRLSKEINGLTTATEPSLRASGSTADLVKQMLSKVKGLTVEARERIVAAAEEPDDGSPGVIPANMASLRPTNEEIVIPQYDIRAAMGAGQVPPDYQEVVRNLVVREDILREKGVSYTSKTSLGMINGWGDSMAGTINDKDLVIVDKGIQDFVGDGVYVLTWGKELYIKRVMRMDEEHYRLISDNQHYENQTARIDDVTIHAKVLLIWNARKA